MKQFLQISFAVFLVLVLATASISGNLEDAVHAYKSKNFKKAYQLVRIDASKGNATAQLFLGSLYSEGAGVPQNYKEAVKWYRLAAEQGSTAALFNLAQMYVFGHGVLKSNETAYAYFSLAYANRDESANMTYYMMDWLREDMTPAQIERAQQLANEIWAKMGN